MSIQIAAQGILMKFSKNENKLETVQLSNTIHHFGILEIASALTARGLGVGRLLMANSEQYAKEHHF